MIANLSPFFDQIAGIERALVDEERVSQINVPRFHRVQPVHVVYGGGHLFRPDFKAKLGRLACAALEQVAEDGLTLNTVLQTMWPNDFADRIYSETLNKLRNDAVEDYRIDFEDGYGLRADEEEDGHVISSASAVVEAASRGKLSTAIGLRPKALSMPTLKRSLRTLVLFVEQFVQAGGRASGLRHLTVTLPKVTNEAQVNGLVEILEKLESIHQLGDNFFDVELLIETPQAFLDTIGNIPLPRLIAAGKGRCVGIHFGVYDFTSSIGIGSAGQSIDHFACDAARFLMHLSAAAVPGVMVSDGIVNLLPIPIHRSTEGLYSSLGLSETQIAENKLALANAWRINFEQMSRSLRFGCYQGWDLHPSQIAIRHVVNRAYVLREFDAAALRLKGFLDRSAQASTFGSTFDDRASARGLVHFMKRALSSGIITAEALNQQGIAIESLSNL